MTGSQNSLSPVAEITRVTTKDPVIEQSTASRCLAPPPAQSRREFSIYTAIAPRRLYSMLRPCSEIFTIMSLSTIRQPAIEELLEIFTGNKQASWEWLDRCTRVLTSEEGIPASQAAQIVLFTLASTWTSVQWRPQVPRLRKWQEQYPLLSLEESKSSLDLCLKAFKHRGRSYSVIPWL